MRISAMIEDPARCEMIADVLKKRAAEEYSVEKMVSLIEDLYHDVLGDQIQNSQ